MDSKTQTRDAKNTTKAILLKKEGGKKITVNPFGLDVAMVVWRKNDGVLLPLLLNRMEAQQLQILLQTAIAEAKGE